MSNAGPDTIMIRQCDVRCVADEFGELREDIVQLAGHRQLACDARIPRRVGSLEEPPGRPVGFVEVSYWRVSSLQWRKAGTV